MWSCTLTANHILVLAPHRPVSFPAGGLCPPRSPWLLQDALPPAHLPQSPGEGQMGAPGSDFSSLVFPTSSTLCTQESLYSLPTQGLPLADPHSARLLQAPLVRRRVGAVSGL